MFSPGLVVVALQRHYRVLMWAVIQLLEHYLLLHLPHLMHIEAMTHIDRHPHLYQSLERVEEMRIIVMWLRWMHFLELDM